MESKKKYEVVYVRLYPKQKEDLMNKIKKSGLDLRSYIIINLGLKNEQRNTTEMNWIDVNKQQPEVYQDVVFIVESWDKHYNKRILGGRYQGFRYGDDEFSVPGISFKGVYWMPLPPLPDELIDTKQTEK